MKKLKPVGWAVVAAGLLFAGRERLAAQRLENRAALESAGTAAQADKSASLGGFFDARISSAAPSLTTEAWLDYALGTFPSTSSTLVAPAASARSRDASSEAKNSESSQPFHWLDVQSNPSVVKEGVGGKARAKRGSGVLIDSAQRRWEIEPHHSSATSENWGGGSAADSADDAATIAVVDPAEIARRKDNAALALKCTGAAAAALLLW